MLLEIASNSVLLRERTLAEGRLFTNNSLLAQTLQEDAARIGVSSKGSWSFETSSFTGHGSTTRFCRSSRGAKARLYDLLRDLSGQLTAKRLHNSAEEVLRDYKDTFEELLADLGKNAVDPPARSEPLDALVAKSAIGAAEGMPLF